MKWILLTGGIAALGTMLLGCGQEEKAKEPAGEQQSPSALLAPEADQAVPPDFVPVDKEPVVISKVEPVYPPEDVKTGQEGKIWLKVLVGKDGSPRKVQVLKREGSEAMERSAIAAAQQFRFVPAQVKNESVAVWVSIPFRFKLASSDGAKTAK